MSKPLWTLPFVLQTTGITLLSWLAASFVDMFPSIKATQFLEVMGRQSLEVYLAAEILQEFVMYRGQRRGGGLWETVVRGLEGVGMERNWSCLCVSLGWAGIFTGVAFALNFMGWKIQL